MNFKDIREKKIPEDEVGSHAECLAAMDCLMHHMDEIKARFGAHMVDFAARRKAFAWEVGKYVAMDFADRARVEKVCVAFEKKVRKVFEELEDRQLNIIADNATGDKSKDERVNDLLDDFREEVEERTNSAHFSQLWREANHEVR